MVYYNLHSYPSDGASARWPRDQANVLVVAPADFLGRLERVFGRQYTFREMPPGYAVFHHSRGSQATRSDLRIYGHAAGHYKSAPEFAPHVRWLMGGMAGRCHCVMCGQGRRNAIRAVKAATRARNSRPLPTSGAFWQLKFLKISSRPTSRERKIKPWALSPPKTYIFENANIINTIDGSIRRKASLCMSDGKIKWIRAASAKTASEPNAIKINATGKYLVPGLIDSHVHITAVPGTADLAKVFGSATLALKEAIADGVFPGPRLFIAGKALSQTGGHGDSRGPHDHPTCCGGVTNSIGLICDGVDECIKGVRENLRTGSDFIKIMGGGGVASPTDALENVQFTSEEIKAITTVAGQADKWVTTHAYTPKAIQHAIRNGVRGIEHGNFIDKETAKLMATHDIFLTPTLITYSEMASPDWTGFLPPESVAKNETVLKKGLQSLQLATDAGVTICYGTDLLGPLTAAQTKEFALRSQVLTPLQLLQSATINPARMLRHEKLLGQLAPGFLADVLILNENPLEDMTVFDKPNEHLLAVVKEGRVFVSRWSGLPQDTVSVIPLIE
ncbi:amidohydrolase [Aureobasidium subglaciale]|nr:amidohydrolase [Aureobasidium subglaciale]